MISLPGRAVETPRSGWSYSPNGPPGAVPMTVTATLTEPIVYTRDGIHLDGLLAAAAIRDLDERTRRRMHPESAPFPPDVPLPLASWGVRVEVYDEQTARLCRERTAHAMRDGKGVLWGWCASAEDATWLLHGKADIRKRIETGLMTRYSDSESVTVSAGALKAYDLALPTVMAHEVRWYALGDPGRVLDMLTRHVPAIGRKKGIGWGTVAEWRVETRDVDWSIDRIDPETGKRVLMRRMPKFCGYDGRVTRNTIRPPYFHPSRVIATTEPGL